MKEFIFFTLVSCFTALIIEVCYLKRSKKKKVNNRDYYANILIVAIIVLTVLVSLWFYVSRGETEFVSSGICLVIIMCISNLLINGVIKMQYWGRKEEKEESYDYISFLYLIALIFNSLSCLLYVKSINLFLTYISVICGKFIWFDARGIRLVISSMAKLLNDGWKQVINKHKGMLLYELVIIASVVIGLVYQSYDFTGKAIYVLNGICFGVGISGFILIIFALSAEKRIKNDEKLE